MEENGVNKKKVSVCISVHNTADLLPRCLDSVCSQTLQSLEIVLVNNGSTDNSEEIMRQYANQHPERSFVIVAQDDRGLAQGRQTGINHSTGDYIVFLDADDYVEKDAYEQMLNCAIENDVDIVEIETFREGKILSSPYVGKVDTRMVLKEFLVHKKLKTMLWLRLYKRSLFDKPVLPNLYTNNEDSFALPCLLYKADSIFFLKKVLHTYSTDNEQGVMHVLATNPQMAEKRFKNRQTALYALPHFEGYVGENGIKEIQIEYNKHKASSLCSFIFTNFASKTLLDKEKAVMDVLPYSSFEEMHEFIKKWIPSTTILYKMVKVLGVNLTYSVYHCFKKV